MSEKATSLEAKTEALYLFLNIVIIISVNIKYKLLSILLDSLIKQPKGVISMGFFSKILEKLGLGKGQAAAPAAKPASTIKPTPKPAASSAKPASAAPSTPKPTIGNYEPKTSAISEVDVVKKLDQLAAGSGLDWKVSIVDLLKLLDIDSSREARNELAKELNCPAELMSDSAKMNTWLHKEVLRQIAANGGNIPQSLLD
jgi:hypothetical protein